MTTWTNNDIYLTENLVKEPKPLAEATAKIRQTNLPSMEVSPAQGKFLYLLAKIKNATRILEIGTYYGYSTMWFAKALPKDGTITTIEMTEKFTKMAEQNLKKSGDLQKANLLTGDASQILTTLIQNNTPPYDLIFIDAHKPSYPEYLALCLKLSKQGTIIIGDNIILGREISLANNPKAEGIREYIEALGSLENIESTALQTVGVKGYDGFTVSVVG